MKRIPVILENRTFETTMDEQKTKESPFVR